MNNRFMDEFILKFTKSFPKPEDSPYKSNQGEAFSWALGYEFHLMRITRSLDPFAVDLFLEYGNGYYQLDTVNVRSQEGVFDFSLSWYFLNLPSTIGKLLGLLGLGARLGESYLDASSWTKIYKYQLKTFPWYYLDFKYRFDQKGDEDTFGWGLSFMVNYQETELTVLETLLDDIRGRINFKEIRWSFGLNFTL